MKVYLTKLIVLFIIILLLTRRKNIDNRWKTIVDSELK